MDAPGHGLHERLGGLAETAGLDYVEDLCMGRESVRLQIAQTPMVKLSRES